jgi:class 3 adenylate cyclase/tetratricopeptide (TPR) repeat protein
MRCSNCGIENPTDAKFCGGCGNGLAHACPACGKANDPGMRFCRECGSALDAEVGSSQDAASAADASRTAPVAERRLVSVLFADLVGFTTISEKRDAEEVRELLSRYFDMSRRLIELYGGTVEKFIGDAVMAVWGTPTATEDDAERAVRAALDLVAAVSALGDEVGATELRARAGVLTGEAAVTIGAEGEGMVAGDLVNTAARIQSAATPGTVLVGESTRRASELTIVYEDAGTHELKGKEESARLFRAVRVASGRRGALKSTGLEPPFVGRDRELRLVKELFHASSDERTAHLVSAMGIAGIGKSRLAWEFYKYFDGLVDTVYWHRGRCLAYGEGVTYWALADMVRMRARISEDDDDTTARSKLEATLSEHILDADERSFVEPLLASLLGIAEEQSSYERHDLFAAWRLFFERLANTYPTVLVFEDMQWADASLLDFVEYLLEWSRSSPLFVLVLARPELLDKRPNWGAGHRNFTSLHLGPLSEAAMTELLDGFVPGLPDALREQILARAEGVPLYAVETVRMLLDRGLLVQEGPVYRPTGEIPSLEVPETLHGLVASRLDGLPAEERRLLQDASVIGKTFTRHALAAMAGVAEGELDPLLGSLARKEILGVQADPTSPEHGQYGFLQDLVRHVSYETLSKRERRARHLAAAAYLVDAFANEDEITEVVASHYLDAYTALPDADDAAEVKEKARAALVRAGDRAESLGAAGEARRYLEQAAGLSDVGSERAALLDRAGWLGYYTADWETAERMLGDSIALFESEGDIRSAARVSGRLAAIEANQGRMQEAVARSEAAFATLEQFDPGVELAELAGRLAMAYVFVGEQEKARAKADLAIELSESLGASHALARGFSAMAIVVDGTRPEEATALFKQCLAISREYDLYESEYSALFNLSDVSFRRDRYDDALTFLADALAIARRRGSRTGEWGTLSETCYPLFMLGRWDEMFAAFQDVPEEHFIDALTLSFLDSVLEALVHRGEVAEASRLLSRYEPLKDSSDVQNRMMFLAASACVARAEGRLEEALRKGVQAAEVSRSTEREASQGIKQGLVEAIEAALALGDSRHAEELLASIEAVPPGLRSPYFGAQALRFRARLAASDDVALESFDAAATRFRELSIPFWLAVTQLELGERLIAAGRADDAEPLLAEAGEIFGRLEAAPWLERVTAVVQAPQARVPA